MTRRLGLSLVLGLFALACSPPSGDQLAASFTEGCLKGCTESAGGSLDCQAYCECATRKTREHRTDSEFSDFIVAAAYNPPPKVSSEIARTAQLCIQELRR